MTTKNTQQQEDQEIDLAQISVNISSFFNGIKAYIYNSILFFKRNIIIIGSLLIIGAGLGYFMDTNFKTYTHEVIVSPNVGGTDYLYSKINLLSSKLKEEDEIFFKSIGVKNPKDIGKIKVEPVLDIYNFVNNSTSAANAENTQNFELVKLLAEDGSLKDVIKDNLTSKNYPYQKIEITTSGKINTNELVEPLLKFINTDEYYNKILQISKDNVIIKMKKNEQQIVQIDSILKFMSINLSQNKNQNLIYNNENNQINPLFESKNKLINEIAAQKINLENLRLFIRDSSVTLNMRNTKGFNGKLKLVLPILFIFGFVAFNFFIRLYKNQEKASLLK